MTDTGILCRDAFGDERAPGKVIGSPVPGAGGLVRRGADAEKGIAIDHGALRIPHLRRAGWGREAIAYGPIAPAPGTVFSVLVLNGHNASDADEIARMRRRQALPRPRRVLDRRRQPTLEGNLAVGWFPRAGRPAPLATALAFVVRGAEGENGELCAMLEGRLAPLRAGLRNVPVQYAVLLRERGAVYYAGSLPGVPGLPAYPALRPLAISSASLTRPLHAGLHQSVLGQAGYQVDTRVYGAHLEVVPEWAAWHGTAQAADALAGMGELGGGWSGRSASGWERTTAGARPGPRPVTWLSGKPGGLLRVELGGGGRGGLVWRSDGERAWSVVVDAEAASLLLSDGAREIEIARDPAAGHRGRPSSAIQVGDDGERIDIHVDGMRAFGGPLRDDRLADLAGAGIRGDGEGTRLRNFEWHPPVVELPGHAALPGPEQPAAGVELVGDGFHGEAGELTGRPLDRGGGRRWCKRLGAGAIDCDGEGRARVRGDRDHPYPGPGFHTVEWPEPGFADVVIEQTPPGRARGEGHRGRVGLVFHGGEDDHLVVNTWLDDAYEGTAVSAFLRVGGHEEHFRSVWCNVGRLISWGRRSRLRVAFDGSRWTVWVGDEPVLQRTITDLYPRAGQIAIREVGIAVNEEYGNDTGTLIHAFSSRGRR